MSTQDTNQRPVPAQLPPLTTPFANIALAFSGGGFRAASFALGTLAYLEKAGLLERVTYLSSASGGTIATAMYALNNAEGKGFGHFYSALHSNIAGTGLLERVMEILNDKDAWKARPHKRRNFINSFAMAYDERLFGHKNLGALTGSKTTHLQEVCFNTTEFYRGILFRQTVKMQPDKKAAADKTYLYGNFIINLEHDTAKGLKLADLMAASSCFPAGFEPIIFPDDFENADATRASLLQHLTVEPQELGREEMELLYGKAAVKQLEASLPKPVDVKKLQETAKKLPLQTNFKAGFMDGGITDNQGVESMLRANDRRVKQETEFKPFDLMMVCDVGSHFMKPYELPEPKPASWLTIGKTMVLCGLLAVLGAAGLIWGIMNSPGVWAILAIIAGTLAFVCGSVVIGLLQWIRKTLASNTNDDNTDSGKLNLNKTFSPQIVNKLFEYFRSTPFSVLKTMMTERGSSMLILNNSVFLKRIRQLLYQRFFDPEKCSHREKASHVYDLSFTNDTNRLQNDPAYLAPSRSIQLVAEQAFNMGTTLWFDEANQKAHTEAALVACGQFTTCYNLLVYIDRLKYNKKQAGDAPEDNIKNGVADKPPYDSFTEAEKQKLDELEQLMSGHYEAFKKDPYWLYNEQCRAYVSKDWKDVSVAADAPLPDDFKGLR